MANLRGARGGGRRPGARMNTVFIQPHTRRVFANCINTPRRRVQMSLEFGGSRRADQERDATRKARQDYFSKKGYSSDFEVTLFHPTASKSTVLYLLKSAINRPGWRAQAHTYTVIVKGCIFREIPTGTGRDDDDQKWSESCKDALAFGNLSVSKLLKDGYVYKSGTPIPTGLSFPVPEELHEDPLPRQGMYKGKNGDAFSRVKPTAQ